MITVSVESKQAASKEFSGLFKFQGLNVPKGKLVEYMATVILSRVRKRFMKQENADGTKWPMTHHARRRLAGGFTYATGGAYAPGGMKTGGNILFSSGNLFHSIQMVRKGSDAYAVRTDVHYAQKYMNDKYMIIGTTEKEVDTILKAAVDRLFS